VGGWGATSREVSPPTAEAVEFFEKISFGKISAQFVLAFGKKN